jgi:hypothetical protein
MTANLHVVRAAGSSSTLQFRPNLPVVRSSFSLERQHIEARRKMLGSGQIVDTASRFLRTIVQLAPSVMLDMQSCSARALNFSRRFGG